jgi:hypothetical protein
MFCVPVPQPQRGHEGIQPRGDVRGHQTELIGKSCRSSSAKIPWAYVRNGSQGDSGRRGTALRARRRHRPVGYYPPARAPMVLAFPSRNRVWIFTQSECQLMWQLGGQPRSSHERTR